ncbi:MAG TPA: hypothetical protein VE422_42695 [Terriglobia bacterium]|nr:hypothetical protein [Terriglobia bacterium]
MSDLNVGDRVELINDIRHRYHSRIGVITAVDHHDVPVLTEFVVKLADGGQASFSGFQLKRPPATTARRLRDSKVSPYMSGLRGTPGDRHMIFGADDFDLHLKVVPMERNNKVLGQLSSHTSVWDFALVTLLVEGAPRETAITDNFGEFILQEVPAGNVSIEVLVPSHCMVATFDA